MSVHSGNCNARNNLRNNFLQETYQNRVLKKTMYFCIASEKKLIPMHESHACALLCETRFSTPSLLWGYDGTLKRADNIQKLRDLISSRMLVILI